MAVTEKRPEEHEVKDEGMLEKHEDIAETVLEQGSIYRELEERRDLEKSYDELSAEEKWWYALEVLYSREGMTYSSPKQLLQDYYQGDLDLDEVPWNDNLWGDDHERGSQTVEENLEFEMTEVMDGHVNTRAEAYIEDREDEGIVYRILDGREIPEKE